MNERVLQIRIGVLVVATCLIAGILIVIFGGLTPSWPGGTYTIFIEFEEAPDVHVQTPVLKNGVLIGRVSNVELPDTGGVLITADIDKHRKILGGEQCRISTGTLLGSSRLEFVLRDAQLDTPVEGGAYMKGITTKSPFDVLVSLEADALEALGSVEQASEQVGTLASNVNEIVTGGNQRFRELNQKAEMALDNFNTAMSRANEILGDEQLRNDLKHSIHDVPKLLDDARSTLARIDSMSHKAEARLDEIGRFTEPLGANGAEMVDSINRSLRNLDAMTGQMVEIGDMLANDSTITRLMTDDELYERMRRAVLNVEQASRQLEPIMQNVRVFSDKIARDPRQLGVKGMLGGDSNGGKPLPSLESYRLGSQRTRPR